MIAARRSTIFVVLAALLAVSTASPALAQDRDDEEPPFETYDALPWEEPPGAMPFIVHEIVDGDTIRVIETEDEDDPDPWYEPVRIIGIDSPEKDSPFTDAECYGDEATEAISALLPVGSTVYLQVDDDEDIPDDEELTADGMEVDDNDRWLLHAYVHHEGTEDWYLVSEVLALGGFVDVRDYEGNTYFVDELQDAEDLARDDDRGLWGAC